MEVVKYDVKTLEYTPTDAVMLEHLAKQLSTGTGKLAGYGLEKQVLPGSQEVELRPAIIEQYPIPLGGEVELRPPIPGVDFIPFVPTEGNNWVELEKGEACPCGGDDDENCNCDHEEDSFLDKSKNFFKEHWMWFAIGAAAIVVAVLLSKSFKKK